MIDEDLDERFKDPDDPFRLVFVCAMWMTGFDVPSCSTIYLDRPMRNHTLMQTIARANRVFPDKENGLIVDYVGVFRNLEAALAIYAAARPASSATDIIRDKSALVEELEEEIGELVEFCERWDVDLDALARRRGIRVHRAARRVGRGAAGRRRDAARAISSAPIEVRRLFAAILPDPAASDSRRLVGVARNLAEKIRSVDPSLPTCRTSRAR